MPRRYPHAPSLTHLQSSRCTICDIDGDEETNTADGTPVSGATKNGAPCQDGRRRETRNDRAHRVLDRLHELGVLPDGSQLHAQIGIIMPAEAATSGKTPAREGRRGGMAPST